MQNPNNNPPFCQVAQIIHALELLMLLTTKECIPAVTSGSLPSRGADVLEDIEQGGIDALGIYYPDKRSIVVDQDKCGKLDREYGEPLGTVELIVLIHELAHFVSHVGLGQPTMREWSRFETSKAWDLERAAQAFTYLLINRWKDKRLMEVFVKMSKSSPPAYGQWESDLGSITRHEIAWGKATVDLWLTSSRIASLDWQIRADDAKGALDI